MVASVFLNAIKVFFWGGVCWISIFSKGDYNFGVINIVLWALMIFLYIAKTWHLKRLVRNIAEKGYSFARKSHKVCLSPIIRYCWTRSIRSKVVFSS